MLAVRAGRQVRIPRTTLTRKLADRSTGGAAAPVHDRLALRRVSSTGLWGAAVVVFIDMKTQKAKRIPEEIRSLLQ